MNYCPNCGTQLNGRFCSNCGYDTQQAGEPVSQNIVKESKPNILTKCKDWVKKAWDWVKNNKKLSILISSSAVVLLTLVIVLSTTLSNIFRVGKVNNIELGMTKEEVTDILGKPTEISENERVYCWYEKKAAKKIEKVVGSFDDLLDIDEDISEEDFEKEFEESFEEADGAYSKLEKLTFKAIIVEFSSDKVTSVFLDKNHKYVEEEYYVSKEEKEVKKTEYDVENEEITFITTVNESGEEIASSNDVPSFEYTMKFKDGSYMLATANPTVEDGKLKWKDNVATYFAKDLKYSRMKITETGKLVSWQGNVLFFEIPNTVTSIASGAFTDCYTLISLTIPESVTEIARDFENSPKLAEIYNKSSVDCALSGDRNVYTPTSGESKLVMDKNGYVIYDGDLRVLVGYTGTKTRLKTPKKIDCISPYAFYGNSKVRKICVSGNNVIINTGAFYNCKQLDKLIYNNVDRDMSYYVYSDFCEAHTKVVNYLHIYISRGFAIILAGIFIILTMKGLQLTQTLPMKKLYCKMSGDINRPIVTKDGTTQTVVQYLMERKVRFSEYFTTHYKEKAKAKHKIGFMVGFGLISSVLVIGGGIGTGFFMNYEHFNNMFAISVLYCYVTMIMCPFAYALNYLYKAYKKEQILYKENFRVLEKYYPEEYSNKNIHSGRLETVLKGIGLRYSPTKRSMMKNLYRNICKKANKEITLVDGSTKTVAWYLQEREHVFKEYLKKQHKRKKKGLLVFILCVAGWMMPVFWNVFVELSYDVVDCMIAFWLFFGIVFPIIYLPIYRARKRKAEKKLYDNHLKVLENYYTEKCKNKENKKTTLEKMLASVGLTWSKKELKAKN